MALAPWATWSQELPVRPRADALPELRLQARVVQQGGKAPAGQKFLFRLTGLSQGVAAAGTGWSEALLVQRTAWETILKSYPNNYLNTYPVVLGISVEPARDPTYIEVRAQWKNGQVALQAQAELFGPRLGLLLWRDEKGMAHLSTQREYNRRYGQVLAQLPVGGKRRPKHLLVVDRFIGGDEDRLAWKEGIEQLARLGCNVVQLPPTPALRDLLLQTGLQRTSWAIYNPPGYAFPFDGKITPESLEAWAREQAVPYLKAGYAPRDMALFVMSDEPGWYYPHMLRVVEKQPAALARFRAYLREQKLQPADLGRRSWEEVFPIGCSQAQDLSSRRLFYWTMRYYSWESAHHFADCVRALEKAFYAGLPVLTNWNFFSGRFYVPGPAANNSDKQHPDAAMGGHDWFEFARLRGGTLLWTEDWFPDSQAYQWSFYCARLRSAAEKGGVSFGGYIVPRSSGDREEGLLQRVLCLAGNGGKAIFYYVFGPEYNFPGNCYSENVSRLWPQMAEANRLLAEAEELLWPGQRPRAAVALLQPRSALVWDVKKTPPSVPIEDATNVHLNRQTVDYLAELFDLYLALQHASIPVDILSEDDLTTAGLKQYKVIYVTEPNVPAEGQQALVDWMRAGGTLVTVSNALTADRYDVPCARPAQAAGLLEKPRPRLLLADAQSLPQVDRITTGMYTLPIYGVRGLWAQPAEGKVLARFADGTPAVLEKAVDAGRLIHFAFLPGIAYWRSATEKKDRLPAGFSEPLRQLILYPVQTASVLLPIRVDRPLIEAPLLLSERGAVVTLLNWSGEPVERLTVSLRLPFAVRQARSLRQGPVPITPAAPPGAPPAEQRLTLPLRTADLLLLYP